jgi:hypothetical protein
VLILCGGLSLGRLQQFFDSFELLLDKDNSSDVIQRWELKKPVSLASSVFINLDLDTIGTSDTTPAPGCTYNPFTIIPGF